jgi:hypothetical protein
MDKNINEAIAGMNTAAINEELKKLDPTAELLTDETVKKLKETLQSTPEDELKKLTEEIANVSGGLDNPFKNLAANHPTVVKALGIAGITFVAVSAVLATFALGYTGGVKVRRKRLNNLDKPAPGPVFTDVGTSAPNFDGVGEVVQTVEGEVDAINELVDVNT